MLTVSIFQITLNGIWDIPLNKQQRDKITTKIYANDFKNNN